MVTKGILSTLNYKWFYGGILAFIVAILSIIWTPYDLVLEERLRMRPGLPPFNWWYNPPDVSRIKLYIFNVTNGERFMSGEDAKLKLEEVGPIVFREVYNQSDVVFNDNGTMSYTQRRNIIFDPSLNTIDLNSTMVFPNMALLFGVSHFWDTNYFLKKLLNYIIDQVNSQPIIHTTLHQILYDNPDRFLKIANKLLPHIAVINNVALMPLINRGSSRMTVLIGTENGHKKFFATDKLNGSTFLPNNDASCKESVQGVMAGLLYPQKLTKTDRLRYFYDLTCRAVPFQYEDEMYRQGIRGYRIVVPKDLYNRTQPPANDCYKGEPPMLNGLADMSTCWFSFPVAASNPYFLHGDSKLFNYVDGMKPNASKHTTYAIIEPVSGIALQSKASIQVNIYMRPLRGFHQVLDKFSDMTLPLFYLEKYHDSVPTYVVIFIRFILSLPMVGNCITVCLFALAVFCIWKFTKQMRTKRILTAMIMDTGKAHTFEMESFIKKSTFAERNNRRKNLRR